MYKPNHTLGRWHYDFDKPGVYMRDPNDTEYNKPPICLAKTFPTAHGDGVPEARRNAKAMAAAPELLLLLRRAVAMHIEEFGEPDTSFAGWTRRRYWEPAQQQAKRAKLTPEEQVEFDAEIARRERGDEWVQEAKGLIKDLVGGWSGVGHRQYFSDVWDDQVQGAEDQYRAASPIWQEHERQQERDAKARQEAHREALREAARKGEPITNTHDLKWLKEEGVDLTASREAARALRRQRKGSRS